VAWRSVLPLHVMRREDSILAICGWRGLCGISNNSLLSMTGVGRGRSKNVYAPEKVAPQS